MAVIRTLQIREKPTKLAQAVAELGRIARARLYLHLLPQTEELPQRIAAEKEAALAEATRQVTAHYEQRILVLQKDAESERKVAALQVAGLQETLKRQTEQMLTLEKAVEEAKRQVQDIALKAIEGASGSRALAHVNQIAMEQAKGRPQG